MALAAVAKIASVKIAAVEVVAVEVVAAVVAVVCFFGRAEVETVKDGTAPALRAVQDWRQ